MRGRRFGRLSVLWMPPKPFPPRVDKARRGQEHTEWTCVCDCGEVLDVDALDLLSGIKCSCGCYEPTGREPAYGLAFVHRLRRGHELVMFLQGRGYPVGLYAKASEARAAAEIYRRDVILPYIRDPLDGLVKLDNDKYDMYFRGEKIGETCYTLEQARNARFLLTARKIGEETGKIE